jgi:hypothetical protein
MELMAWEFDGKLFGRSVLQATGIVNHFMMDFEGSKEFGGRAIRKNKTLDLLRMPPNSIRNGLRLAILRRAPSSIKMAWWGLTSQHEKQLTRRGRRHKLG